MINIYFYFSNKSVLRQILLLVQPQEINSC